MAPVSHVVITLRSGDAGAQLCPAAGGSIARYWQDRAGGAIEWLRPATADAIARRDPLGMASFPLVPFSNRIRDGRFHFDGSDIALPLNFPPERHTIHGQGWQSPWSVTERAEDRAILQYVHAAGDWPFDYRARQVFALTPDALNLTISVTNEGDRRMPCGLGPHPYFIRTPKARITANVERMWGTDAEVMPTDLTDPPPDKRVQDGVVADAVAMDNTFTGWDGRAVIAWPEWNASLAIEADPALGFLVVFTPPGEDFFCVEPVSNCTDAFNYAATGRTDTGMIVLEPGRTMVGHVRFRPESPG